MATFPGIDLVHRFPKDKHTEILIIMGSSTEYKPPCVELSNKFMIREDKYPNILTATYILMLNCKSIDTEAGRYHTVNTNFHMILLHHGYGGDKESGHPPDIWVGYSATNVVSSMVTMKINFPMPSKKGKIYKRRQSIKGHWRWGKVSPRCIFMATTMAAHQKALSVGNYNKPRVQNHGALLIYYFAC